MSNKRQKIIQISILMPRNKYISEINILKNAQTYALFIPLISSQ